ncbi:MAG: hypothetical protein HQK50_15765 [Oligoflexia bacterium]|nr:hypothetical protein [Oligoflexia bacterium]MBF0367031.1 hypothetical protein [Oligoflexia bacterium]
MGFPFITCANSILYCARDEVNGRFKEIFQEAAISSVVVQPSLIRAQDYLQRILSQQGIVHSAIFYFAADVMASPEWKKFYSYVRGPAYKSLPLVIIVEEMLMNSAIEGGAGSNAQSEALVLANRDPAIVTIVVDPKNIDFVQILEKVEATLMKYYPNGVSFFKIEQGDNYKMVTMPEEFTKHTLSEIKKLEALLSEEKDILIFNFKNFSDISNNSHRVLFQLFTGLEKYHRRFRSIFVKDLVQGYLKKGGIVDAFKIKSGLREVLLEYQLIKESKPEASKYVTLDVRIINPFIAALMQAYKKHIDVTLNLSGGPKIVNQYKCENASFAIAINVESEKFCGSILQLFSYEVFKNYLKIVKEKKQISELPAAIDFTKMLLLDIFEMAKGDLIKLLNYEISKATPIIIQSTSNIQKAIQYPTTINVRLKSSIGTVELLINPQTL